MKLHLPAFLRKSLLSCLSTVIVCTVGSGAAWANPQNLTFEGGTLTWDTQSESFTDESDAATAFAEGDNVSFTGESDVALGQDITAGTVAIEQGAAVTIDLDVYELNVDRIELSGLLDMGYSLHIGEGTTLAVQSAGAVLDSNLVLEEKGGFEVGAAASLNNNLLTLQGNTSFTLTAAGDGKTYTLFTGVSGLQDAQGNAISLDSSNNAASLYFDTTRPGTGFWANGTLQLNDGVLQMVLHDEVVKEVLTITSRVTSGGVYQYYKGISFENISSLAGGGAIYGEWGSTITLSDNGSVTFSGNTASHSQSDSSDYSASGGAICGYQNGTITLSDNGSVVFEGNTSSASSHAYGGAIYGDWGSTITLSNIGSVVFEGNTASSSSAYGGAIFGFCYSAITLSDNGSVSFSGNTASASSSANGGAIYGESISTITLSDNGSVTFSGNTASSSSYYANGGAIYGDVTMTGNGDVSFSGNTASSSSYDAYGGAICGVTITLSNNGSVTFSGNTASSSDDYAYGGAIDGGLNSTITLSDNGSVTFSGNTASGRYAYGGAIYTYGDLSIRNNDSVEFYQNAEVANGYTYRLRSIYAYGGSGDEISLSAAAGKSITFRDSIYIGEGSSFKLNEAYEGKAQLGDIIFTGATTVDDLYTVKGNVAGTAEEIRLSRTTEVNTLTELYGGRLRVEEGAIYQGQGITAMEGSAATVRVQNATLSHSGYDLTFNAGTTLELVGSNSISGNLNLLGGSTLHIDYAGNEFTTNLNGSTLALTGDAFLRLTGAGNGDGKTYTLFTGVSGLLDAQGNAITLDPANNAISDYFDASQAGTGFWANGTLHLNNGALQMVLHNETVKEAITITSRQVRDVDYQYYDSIIAKNIVTSSESSVYGAVLSGELVNLSNIGKVEFTGNSNFSVQGIACGGGIYGGLVTMNHNGCISFTENSVSTSQDWSGGNGYYAAGGAMEISVGELCNNGRVEFIGNSAIRAGAIYITGNSLAINDNESVVFIGNKSREGGGAIHATPMDMVIELSRNGSVIFSGNQADMCGGAIYPCYGDIRLNDNGIVRFDGNIAYESNGWLQGGAISSNGKLSICNNDNVLFEKNVEKASNLYRLRSIYLNHYNDGDIRGISLSAAAEKFIEFRDSVYINVGHALSLNADYEGAAGKVIKQTGDIIFTGKYAEAHLNEILEDDGAGRGATVEEIQASRTTEVNTLTNLYGGRLRVEDGAIYLGQGITVHEGSEATVRVKNAELSHVGYNLTFNDGTALEVAGESTIRGLVNLQEGSVFKLEQGATLNLYETNGDALSVGGLAWLEGASTLNADLTLAEGSTLDIVSLDAGAVALNGVLTFGGQVTLGENLLALLDEKLGHESSITLFTGLENVDWATVTGNAVSDCVWAGAVFSNMAGNHSCYLNYASDTGSLVMQIVPEPATATLSLLALAALAVRRRRK